MKINENLLTNLNLETLNLKDLNLLLEIIDLLYKEPQNEEIEVI